MNDKPTYPVPQIKEAYGNTVFSRYIRDLITLAVKIWDGAAVRQKYYIWLDGYDSDGEAIRSKLVYSDYLTRRELDKGVLEVSLPKSILEELSQEYKFALKFGVDFVGGGEADATLFPYESSRWVDDLYKDLTVFDGSMNGWKAGSGIDPADLTFDTRDGRNCLHCHIKGKLPEQTLLYKDFDVVSGRKYYFDVSFSLASVEPPEPIIVGLEEGKKYEGWVYYGKEKFVPIGRGFAAGSSRLRLGITAATFSATGSRSLYLTDILLYELPAVREWDPEWDKEYESHDRPDPKEPQEESSDRLRV